MFLTSISGFGNIQILTGELLSVDVAVGANHIFSGQFSGEGGLVKQGEGSQVLAGNSSGYGPFRSVVVEEGELVISLPDAVGVGNVIDVNDGATLTLQSNQEFPSGFGFQNRINFCKYSHNQT